MHIFFYLTMVSVILWRRSFWLKDIFKTGTDLGTHWLFTGKSSWKVVEHDVLGLPNRKFPGATEHLKKVVLFIPDGKLQTEIRVPKPFSGKWNWFEQMVNAIPGRNLPVPNFSNHLSKPWTDPQFARSKWVVYPSSQKICLESKVDSKRNSDFSGWFRWNIFWSKRFLKRWSCFSRQNIPIGNSCSQLESCLKAMFDTTQATSFRLSRPFFVEWNWFGQMVNAIPRRNLPVLNFASQIRSNYRNREPTGLPV